MRYSAGDGEGFAITAAQLDVLPHAPLTAQAAATALTAQAELAAKPGISHRVKPADLLISSIVTAEDIGVLHYDDEYDTILEHTSLSFRSVWAGPRGTIV